MGFFSKLFGRKKNSISAKGKISADELDINIIEDVFVINGTRIEIPCMLDSFIEVFGKPSRVAKKYNDIYTWDELGVYCYTRSGNKVVFCFTVRTGPKQRFDFQPNSVYIGKLTINGASWVEAVSGGEDTDVSHRIELGGFKINADYCDSDEGSGGYNELSVEI